MKFLSGWWETTMNKIYVVARREYFETIRTKGFVIGNLITLAFMLLMFFVIGKEERGGFSKSVITRRIAILCPSVPVGEEIRSQFAEYEKHKPTEKYVLDMNKEGQSAENYKNQVMQGSFDAFLDIQKDILNNDAPSQIYIRTENIQTLRTVETIQHLVNKALTNSRFRQNNILPETIRAMQRPAVIQQVELSAVSKGKSSKFAVIMLPFFFMYLLFLGIVGSGQQLLANIVEEKSSRVIEVLLSSLTPFQLMAGKILGLAAVGFTTIIIWAGVLGGFAHYKGVSLNLSPALYICFPLYFTMGFLLITSLIAAIGSTCNQIREAQSYMAPVMILLVLPMMLWFMIAQNPNSTLAVGLSFIPLITPMMMVLRMASSPNIPLIQIIGTLVLLGASVPLMMWFSAKIFRVGILMFGKQPSPREILRWLRYK